MEVGNNNTTTTTITSSWIVKNGSLDNSVTFDTPFSEINEEESNSPKDQLQLIKPSSPDSGPCEITISFSQKHEIQQIYVRSTARVYEIYYAPDQKSSNEYLCTVRCSAAAKEDATLDASDTGEANGLYPEGSSETMELHADEIKNDSHGTNEDDWVEVKVPASPSLDSMSDKINRNNETSNQDLYEATAEITDADPCISITLRLLSLQTQGCVYLEEIYIFGEPVEPSDSEHEVGPLQGSSLMSMLVPTLLQLSKSRSQEKNASDTRESLKYQDDKSRDPKIGSGKQQDAYSSIPSGGETKREEVAKRSADLTPLESDKQIHGTGQGPEFVSKENGQTYGRIERVLDHLVSRVGRIEAFCLRFEEKMLEPISSIERRLERLEMQLEVLTTRSQLSEFNSGTRITAPEFSCSDSLTNSLLNDGNNPCSRFTAPDFSCSESLSNSFHNDGNNEQLPKGSEYASKDSPCRRISTPELLGNESDDNSRGLESAADKDREAGEPSPLIGDASVSSVSPQLIPGMVITAPEFSSDNDGEDEIADIGDDKNCTEVLESAEKTSSIGKKSLSIDDALASALSGFLSATSVQSAKFTQTSEVMSPANENPYDTNKLKSPSSNPCKESADSGNCCDESNRAEHVMELTAESSDLIPEQTAIYEDWFRDPDYESEIVSGDRTQLENQPFAERECYGNVDYSITETIVAFHNLTTSMEVQNQEHEKSDAENVLKRMHSSVVDFDQPILDVTFAPLEKWNSKSLIEALLDDKQESKPDSCVNYEDGDGLISVEQSQMLSVEDDKLQIPTLDNQLLLVGIDGPAIGTVVPNKEPDLALETDVHNKEPEHFGDSSACRGEESFSSLI